MGYRLLLLGGFLSDQFLDSVQCRSRAACGSCRASSEWRHLLHAPEVCPHGVTLESLPSIDYSAYQGDSRGPQSSVGPGAELKKLLAAIGIAATPNCSCNARAAEMDRQGCDWCQENIDTIVGWLREEAEKRGLPFLDAAGRLLVKRAIRNARKAAAATTPTPPPDPPPPVN
jgi:hypothetical protein